MIYCMLLSLLKARKGIGCTDALLIISHHLQKSLAARMECYIVILDFSVAYDMSELQ